MRSVKTYSDGKLYVIIALASMWSGLASASGSGFTGFDGQRVAAITYDPQAGVPIQKAADLLSHDLTQLTGHAPVVTANMTSGGDGIIVGLASSPYIAQLLRRNGISTVPLAGKWETYGRAVIPAPWNARQKALLIFGSDKRGTIWGVPMS